MEHSLGFGQSIALGLVQALTEFLPVSSSGHIVIVKWLLKVGEVGITLEVVTHLATALAVIIYLRGRIAAVLRSLWRAAAGKRRALTSEERGDLALAAALVVGSIPAAILGFALNDFFEGLFDDVAATSLMLVITGVFLLLVGRRRKEGTALRLLQALVIGVAQALAIIPGISRSGLTVGTGLALGVDRRQAFEFSLLLSVPAILGATALEALSGDLGGEVLTISASALTAFVAGYFAIAALFRAVVGNKFHYFGYYLIPAGLLVAVLARLR